MPASTSKQAAQLWLPALNRFALDHPLHRLLIRADQLADGEPSRVARLATLFAGAGPTLPAAALVREDLRHDAGDTLWLNADPAWLQPDMTGVRLLAIGSLPVEADEAEAFAELLRPSFVEAGMTLELSSASCWQLRLPADTLVPDFAAPEQALGDDLYLHLPAGDAGRRWRVLLNEVQVALNEHPLNQARERRGASPINSVWLWGAGRLPAAVHSDLAGMVSSDALARALAARAQVRAQPADADALAGVATGWLVDLQDVAADELGGAWWPALEALARRCALQLVFAGGERWSLRLWHRWRVWRKVPH